MKIGLTLVTGLVVRHTEIKDDQVVDVGASTFSLGVVFKRVEPNHNTLFTNGQDDDLKGDAFGTLDDEGNVEELYVRIGPEGKRKSWVCFEISKLEQGEVFHGRYEANNFVSVNDIIFLSVIDE